MSRRGFLQRAGDGFGQLPLFQDHSASFAGNVGGLILSAGLPLDNTKGVTVAWWQIEDVPVLTASNFLLGCWPSNTDSTKDRFLYYYDSGLGVARMLWYDAAGNTTSPGGGGEVVQTWSFRVERYDPSTFPAFIHADQYINNIGPGTGAGSSGLLNPVAAAFEVGQTANSSGRFWPGRIDSLGIWNRLLSTSDVNGLWNNGQGWQYAQQAPAGTMNNIVAWWSFDEPTGSPTWFDTSGNGRHLKQVGTVHSGGKRNT